MADFRKWFVVLAVVLLAAATASAQVTCIQGAQPNSIRAGGITEYIGEVDLNCTNEGAQETAQFVLSLNTTVTNAITGKSADGYPVVQAGAAVQTTGGVIAQVVPGIVYATGGNVNNALRFPSVILPTGTTFIVRFVNVRADASQPFPPLVTLNGQTEIVGFVSASLASGASITFSNQTVTGLPVAVIGPAVSFTVTDCTGAATTAAISLQQCVTSIPGSAANYGVTFTELQTTTFKTPDEENGLSLTDGTNIVCDGNIDLCATATVSNGVQLLAQWTVPAALVGKIHIWVSPEQTASNEASTVTAELATVPTNSVTPIDVVCNDTEQSWIQLDDAAVETAAWTVTGDDLGSLDFLTFGWTVSYQAGALPTSSVNIVTLAGTLGPQSTLIAPAKLSAGAPVVRFDLPYQTPKNPASITVAPCVTTLLFPYVTNVVGYDTGLAIANTSLDPFKTPNQTGVCTLTLYGSATAQNMAGDGTTPTATADVTMAKMIAPGTVFADTLENIFGLQGTSGLTTLSGYVMATCNFQYAHGYAYIVSPSGQPQGYLALILGGSASTRSSSRSTYEHLDQ